MENEASDSKVNIKLEQPTSSTTNKVNEEYFQCSSCKLRLKYDYFGRNPEQLKNYLLLEDSFVIEDPFTPPKQGNIIILGAFCTACRKIVCKDMNCSFYYDGTYCIRCAKFGIKSFPKSVQEKLNKII